MNKTLISLTSMLCASVAFTSVAFAQEASEAVEEAAETAEEAVEEVAEEAIEEAEEAADEASDDGEADDMSDKDDEMSDDKDMEDDKDADDKDMDDKAMEDGADPAISDYVYGDPDAPVTLVEYASFTCPHCANFESQVMPKLEEEYIEKGLVNLVYREVYFDGAGLLAASLARCVPQEQYYPMVFTIYDTLPTWLHGQEDAAGIINELTKLGVMAGLPKDDIVACLDDREMQEKMIENAKVNIEADKVQGTPTLLIDGEKVEKWDWENLKPVLDAALEDAGVEVES